MKQNAPDKVNLRNIKSYKIVEIINDRYYAVECTLLDSDSKITIIMEKEKFQQFRNKHRQKINEDLKSFQNHPPLTTSSNYNSPANRNSEPNLIPFFVFLIILCCFIIWFIFININADKAATNTQTTNYTQKKKNILSSVEKAFVVCSFVERTDSRLSCNVSGFNSSVDVKVLTSPEVAEKMCSEFKISLLKNGYYFESGWEIRIFSPLNDSRPIASCYLPN